MAETEHAGEIGEGTRQIGRAEKNPAEQHDEKRDRDPERFRKVVIETFAPLAPLEREHSAVHSPPDDEVPRRAMPEPTEEHGEDQVNVSAAESAPVSAQGDVKILAQPGGERDVPAPPEIGDRFRAI